MVVKRLCGRYYQLWEWNGGLAVSNCHVVLGLFGHAELMNNNNQTNNNS